MNKKQLLREIRIRARITNVETEAFFKAFCKILSEQLSQGKETSFHNFGKFYTRVPAPRKMKLPGESKTRTIIPERKVRFKPFLRLINTVNAT
jgi:nucleoid DNA-binding protein